MLDDKLNTIRDGLDTLLEDYKVVKGANPFTQHKEIDVLFLGINNSYVELGQTTYTGTVGIVTYTGWSYPYSKHLNELEQVVDYLTETELEGIVLPQSEVNINAPFAKTLPDNQILRGILITIPMEMLNES